MGSPPQVRGKLSAYAQIGQLQGITPAGAGKTISLCPDRAIARDHPRRCGENPQTGYAGRYSTGSPPQVRGKLGRALGMAGFGRITPAGAGKTR